MTGLADGCRDVARRIVNGRRVRMTAPLMLLLPCLALSGCDADRPVSPAVTVALSIAFGGIGDGLVTSAPGGIECTRDGGACQASFEQGTVVTLTAAATDPSSFEGWSGAGDGTAARRVTMIADLAVAASFDHPRRAEAAIGAAGGSITSRDGRLTLTFPAGAVAGVEAIRVEDVDASALGPEFDPILEDFGLLHAYELQPAGLTFSRPVAVRLWLDQDPPEDGAIAVSAALVLISDGETVEPLDGLLAVLDDETGQAVMTGEIGHFSFISISELLVTWLACGRTPGVRDYPSGIPELF